MKMMVMVKTRANHHADDRDTVVEEEHIKNHIIICQPDKVILVVTTCDDSACDADGDSGNGADVFVLKVGDLYSLILPLRRRKQSETVPIVILRSNEPDPAQWRKISIFPFLYFVLVSANSPVHKPSHTC